MASGAQQKTILVVEDNPTNMKLVVDLLELKDFNVLQAEDGTTALQILEGHTPELILLDINLPKMSGIDVFKKIRENQRFDSVVILALTALVMTQDQELIANTGFDGYIAKPIDTRKFIQQVTANLPINCQS